jgi:protocatechuate 3,4-dioxygenase beta subunit
MIVHVVLWSVMLFPNLFTQENAEKKDGAKSATAAAAAVPASPEEDLTRVKAMLAAGKLTVDDVMSSTEWSHLRENPRFRRAIREAARGPRAVIVPRDEPGAPLVVSGIVRDESGSPIASALVYVFQTSDNGSYSSRGGNAGDMGDSLNPRIFGYMKTGADGKYEFRTIRPGQYPNDGPPAHVHYEISAPGFETKATELMFEDDSRMTEGTKKWVLEAGFVIGKPARGDDGVSRVTADWTLARG